MRLLTIVALLLIVTVTGCAAEPSVTAEPTQTRIPPAVIPETPTLTSTLVNPMTPPPTPSQEPTPEGPQLVMVHIRARSSREVRQLRDMKLDIAKVRPDPDRPPDEKSLSSGYIVEAVVTRGMHGKLEAMGFEVVEIPPPEK